MVTMITMIIFTKNLILWYLSVRDLNHLF